MIFLIRLITFLGFHRAAAKIINRERSNALKMIGVANQKIAEAASDHLLKVSPEEIMKKLDDMLEELDSLANLKRK